MRVGTLVGLWRYPVKSMAGEQLREAEVGWNGLAGDRRWAFVRPGLERSGFPRLTLRERADMRGFVPRFQEPGRPDESITIVAAPDGNEYDLVDERLARMLGDGVRVIRRTAGLFDEMPISLISVGTLRALGAIAERPLEPERFRPNLLVDTGDGSEFPEDAWVGHTLRIGAISVRIDKRDERCAIVTIDPTSGVRDPRVLREIAQQRDGCAGVYGSVVTPGVVAVGDAVVLE
jgi:uncharacterized protein YcbX